MLRATAVLALSFPLLAQGWVDRTTVTGPAGRHGHAMCYDAAHNYVLLWGGSGGRDAWSWNGTAWTNRGSFPNVPEGNNGTWDHYGVAMAFHPPTNQVVMVASNGTYSWDGSGWAARGQLPTITGNADYAFAFDPVRSQMVLFVGASASSSSFLQPANDTLLWDGFGWTVRQPAVRPSPTYFAHMAFDPAAGKLLLATSDQNRTQTYFWEWSGSNWSQRSYASAPTASGAMDTDTAHGLVVMQDGSLDPQPNHTWTLRNGQGSRLGTPAEPARRFLAAMTFDPVHSRFVLFGGTNNASAPWLNELGDTWEFDLGAGAAYSTYGTGCAGSRGVPALAPQNNSLPRIGQTFELHVGNLPFTGPAFLFLGFSNTAYGPTPLPFGLAPLGAPGCSILASGDALLLLTNVLGNAAFLQPIPNVPGTVFFTQAFALDPTANALGVTSSNAGQATIGF